MAALLLTGCGSLSFSRKPEPYKPRYVYMVLYGGQFHRYPYANSGVPEVEIDIEASKMSGSMCFTPEEWAKRENYILDLEAFTESK